MKPRHRLSRASRAINVACAAFLLSCGIYLAGCGGGQQVGGQFSPLGGDIGQNYGPSLATSNRKGSGINGQGNALNRGAYPMIETSFLLGSIPGDPFDFEKVSVQVNLKKADGGTVLVPAFFDGGTTWRMRYTPTVPGQYGVVDVKLNGATVHEDKLEKRDWTVSGNPKSGFVRIDHGNHAQFALDNGDKYFPIGHNVAWETDEKAGYSSIFGKMHSAGENWSRVWLDQRDGKHLDAAAQTGAKAKLGEIDLDLAKRWDGIVSAAEKNDIFFQLVLENSDSFSSATGFNDSSNVHPAWDKNPLNTANGGILKSPDSFFVDPAARALEKRKLFYILARWGYSPNIMGLELFRDVQNTDAAFGKHWDDIAMWHREMALFAKNNDINHHLLTTSSAPGVPLESNIWDTVDYIQTRVYSTDVLSTLTAASATTGKKLDKPSFIVEFGTPDASDPDGSQLHAGLWAGLLAGGSGAAQYWDWENTEKKDLYDSFKSASAFALSASLAEHPGLVETPLNLDTTQKAALSFGPGADTNATGGPTEFVVGANGPPSGIERLSPTLHGKAGNGKPLSFNVSYTQAGTFTVQLGKVSMSGAHLKVAVDGKVVEKDFAATKEAHAVPADQQSIKVDVAAGSHTITVSNDGADWIGIRRFTLSNYASALGGVARSSKDYAIAWIYNRDGVEAGEAASKSVTPASGHIKIAGLQKGKYRATWWDTYGGKTIDSTDIDVTNAKEDTVLTTPPVTRDIALFVMKAGTDKAAIKAKHGKKNTAQAAALTNGSASPAGSAANLSASSTLAPSSPN